MPAARPYNLGVGCWIQQSQERIFDNPVSLIFCCISDSNVVGAPRRGARPGLRVYVQRQMREHLASDSPRLRKILIYHENCRRFCSLVQREELIRGFH